MKHALRIVAAGLFSAWLPIVAAADTPTVRVDATSIPVELRAETNAGLDDLKWVKRPIVVFADSPNDPRFAQQMEFLLDRPDELADRDVVVFVDTDPAALGPLREKLRPRGFMLVLIGKDGGVKLRKPFPWDVRELMRSIDKMPLRQRELSERLDG